MFHRPATPVLSQSRDVVPKPGSPSSGISDATTVYGEDEHQISKQSATSTPENYYDQHSTSLSSLDQQNDWENDILPQDRVVELADDDDVPGGPDSGPLPAAKPNNSQPDIAKPDDSKKSAKKPKNKNSNRPESPSKTKPSRNRFSNTFNMMGKTSEKCSSFGSKVKRASLKTLAGARSLSGHLDSSGLPIPKRSRSGQPKRAYPGRILRRTSTLCRSVVRITFPFVIPAMASFTRSLRSRYKFRGLFFSRIRHTDGTYTQAQDAVKESSHACRVALHRISALRYGSKEMEPKLAPFREQIKNFDHCMDAVITLCSSQCNLIQYDVRLTLMSMVFLLSVSLVHTIRLLENRRFPVAPKGLLHERKWLAKVLPVLLTVDIPWAKDTAYSFSPKSLELTIDQHKVCDMTVKRGHFNQLQNLIAKMDRRKTWKRVLWSDKHTDGFLVYTGGMTKLLQHITDMCQRNRWVGLMLPLPATLKLKQTTTEPASARASFHLGWVLPIVFAGIVRWLGSIPDHKFTLGTAKPKRSGEWGDTGMWLVNSEYYKAWYGSKDGSNERFLWCLGGIGMGKSVLTHVVSEYYIQKATELPIWLRPIIVQIHFHHKLHFTMDELLKEMLRQVLSQAKAPTDYMVSIYDKSRDGTPDKATTENLYRLLRELVDTYKIYFFLDGLDECSGTNVEAIMDGMLSLGNKHRVICFSRPFSGSLPQRNQKFTFQNIKADKSDIKHCFTRAVATMSHVPNNRSSLLPQEERELFEQVWANSQEAFLLLASQLEDLSQQSQKDLKQAFTEATDTVFNHYQATMRRIAPISDSKHLFVIIAWVGVKGHLSISEDVPVLVPRLPDASADAMRRHVENSLGLLEIVDDNIRFTTDIGRKFVTTQFRRLFPSFISELQFILGNSGSEVSPSPLLDDINDFLKKSKDVFGESLDTAASRRYESFACLPPNTMSSLLHNGGQSGMLLSSA